MLQSQLLTKTSKTIPKEATTTSHQLLLRAGFIRPLTAGVFCFLPLGWRVYKKLENLIRDELNAIGCQEVFLPVLIPADLWKKTNRWETMDPPLFKLKDRHNKWFGLGSTHEEVITELVKDHIFSYKDLPQALYQIQIKFRNEIRTSGGLLRTKEFFMKDLYSFHQSEADLKNFYREVEGAYQKIFTSCELKAVAVKAHSGSIGGEKSQEFMVLAETGEDKILFCRNCGWGANIEVGEGKEKCPVCQAKLELKNTIEIGHLFELGSLYSQKLNATFVDQKGKKKFLVMGCYGLGLPRIISTVVETSHDENGIIWPKKLSPFDYHLLSFERDKETLKVYKALIKNGKEVLFDDRSISPGEKLKDADLIGIYRRLIISQKTKDMIEYKERGKKKMRLIKLQDLIS